MSAPALFSSISSALVPVASTLCISEKDEALRLEILEMKSLEELYQNPGLFSKLTTGARKCCFDVARAYINASNSPTKFYDLDSVNGREKAFVTLALKQVKSKDASTQELEPCLDLGATCAYFIRHHPKSFNLLSHLNHLIIQEMAKHKGEEGNYLDVDNLKVQALYHFFSKWEGKWGFSEAIKKQTVRPIAPSPDCFRKFFVGLDRRPIYGTGCSLELRCHRLDPETSKTLLILSSGGNFNANALKLLNASFKMQCLATCIWREFDPNSDDPNSLGIGGDWDLISDKMRFYDSFSLDQVPHKLRGIYHSLRNQFKPYIAGKLSEVRGQIIEGLERDFDNNCMLSFTEFVATKQERLEADSQAYLELIEEAVTDQNEGLLYYLLSTESPLSQKELEDAEDQENIDPSSSAAAAAATPPNAMTTMEELSPYDFSLDTVAQAMRNRVENQRAIQPSEEEMKIKEELKLKKKKEYKQKVAQSRSYIEFRKGAIRAESSRISAETFLSKSRRKDLDTLRAGTPLSQVNYFAFKETLIKARAKALGIAYTRSGEGSHLVGHADRGFTLYHPHKGDYLPNAREQLREARSILFFTKPIP